MSMHLEKSTHPFDVDAAWCGFISCLGTPDGFSSDPTQVTCLPCLQKAVELGNACSSQIGKLYASGNLIIPGEPGALTDRKDK